MPTLNIFIQYSTGSPSYNNQARKQIKDIQTEQEKVKLSLFADDMILYIENPKDSTKKKKIELINKFSIVAGYKINIQKLTAFLYINYKLSEKEMKKTIPFTIALEE